MTQHTSYSQSKFCRTFGRWSEIAWWRGFLISNSLFWSFALFCRLSSAGAPLWSFSHSLIVMAVVFRGRPHRVSLWSVVFSHCDQLLYLAASSETTVTGRLLCRLQHRLHWLVKHHVTSWRGMNAKLKAESVYTYSLIYIGLEISQTESLRLDGTSKVC